ncbi:hypothetical protein SAMN05428936_102451 [Pelagibacterium halotolerans]|nr:DUF1801 domain-containing protein [Pelagibacterium halotolerans]QJR20563.1 DUF1801 domain-containing protein [Pelagibacterium halotolerans]SEA24547.1 hypothetical protein SAMN05428936_102451 [Pelagibacterium halotolerans]
MKGIKHESIAAYHAVLADEDRAICDRLRAVIDRTLPEAESKIWHAHPVWFLDGNPIVGYSKLKHCVRLLFWSGQSFATPGLAPEGTFKAAEARFTEAGQVDDDLLMQWLEESRKTQWDYKNLIKKRKLERLS